MIFMSSTLQKIMDLSDAGYSLTIDKHQTLPKCYTLTLTHDDTNLKVKTAVDYDAIIAKSWTDPDRYLVNVLNNMEKSLIEKERSLPNG